jgi:hypothetical protein
VAATPTSGSDQQAERRPDYGNTQKVADLVRRCIDDAQRNTARLERDKQDLQNLQFYRGGADNQWTVWDPNSNSFVPRPYSGEASMPEWVPRCTTNRFGSKVDGITSLLVSATPALQWGPSTDDDEDIAAAEVAQGATDVLLEEIEWARKKREISHLVALTDKVAIVYSYDTDPKYGMGEVQLLQCPKCGTLTTPIEVQDAGEACPQCGQTEEMEDAVDGTANPVTMEYPKGRICADVHTSFEFSLPSSARHMAADANPWVLLHSRMAKEDALRLFGRDQAAREAIEGASGTAKQSHVQRHFADTMRKLSAPRAGTRMGTGNPSDLGPVVYRLQHDPIEDAEFSFPQGLYAVVIGDHVLDSGPLPLTDGETGRAIKTVLIRSFRDGFGSQYGKPPADDLVPLQIQRNLVETLILMILMHDAAPRTFVPLSVTLEDEITGQPGQQIRYRSTNGEKPTTDRGVNPPEGLYKQIELIDQTFEELSGMNAVLQGQRPDGDPTLGEVEILKEQGQSAFKCPLDVQVDFEKAQARMLLAIARQSWWSPRFRKVRGENGEWDVQAFSAASLTGNVDVHCDPSSAWPRSPMMQSLRLKRAVELGILMPQQDPELASKLLEQENLAELKPSLDVDRKQVARELDRWKAARTPDEILPPQQPPLINLALHLHLKTMFLRTEEAETLARLNPPVHQAMLAHVMQLQAFQQQEQMQQALMSGAVKPPAPPAPDSRTPVERGDSSSLQGAIDSGALKPAGAATAGAPTLDDAVSSGALQPAGVAVAQQAAAAAALPSIDEMVASRALQPLQQRPPVGPTGAA